MSSLGRFSGQIMSTRTTLWLSSGLSNNMFIQRSSKIPTGFESYFWAIREKNQVCSHFIEGRASRSVIFGECSSLYSKCDDTCVKNHNRNSSFWSIRCSKLWDSQNPRTTAIYFKLRAHNKCFICALCFLISSISFVSLNLFLTLSPHFSPSHFFFLLIHF
jgi:hypothetical protein